jgi:TfoX/Sxy family transcriptional regulator of competence genes
MASDPGFVEYVVDQLDESCAATYRKMFGEYALYSHGKVFGLICDNRLFVKRTEPGRAFIGKPVEAPAYPGATPSFLIEDRLEDAEWLSELVRITTLALPATKPKKKTKGGRGKRGTRKER